MKDELSAKIMTRFVALRPKSYKYLTDNSNGNKPTNKKPKET